MIRHQQIKRLFVKVNAIAYEYAKSVHDAEDIAQTALTKIFSKESSWTSALRTVAYVTRTVRNTAYDFYRKQNRCNTYFDRGTSYDQLTGLGLVCEDSVIYITPATKENTTRREELEDVLTAMKKLKPDDRRILNMVEQGFSYKQIAQEEQLLLGTVRSRIHNARRRLRKLSPNN